MLIGTAMAVLVLLQLGALGTIDPVRTTVSDLVYAPGGQVMFPLMGAICVAGSIMIAVRLVRNRWWTAAGAMIVWCLGLGLASAFPTDPPTMATLSVSAQIHRYAAAAMFVAIPLAGFFTARAAGRSGTPHSPTPHLIRASVLCAVMGVGQFAVSIPSLLPDSDLATWPGVVTLFSMRGLAERLLFVTMIIVLFRLGRSVPMRPAAGPEPIFHGGYRGNHPASTRGAAAWQSTRSTPPASPRDPMRQPTRSRWQTDPSSPSPVTGSSHDSESASCARAVSA